MTGSPSALKKSYFELILRIISCWWTDCPSILRKSRCWIYFWDLQGFCIFLYQLCIKFSTPLHPEVIGVRFLLNEHIKWSEQLVPRHIHFSFKFVSIFSSWVIQGCFSQKLTNSLFSFHCWVGFQEDFRKLFLFLLKYLKTSFQGGCFWWNTPKHLDHFLIFRTEWGWLRYYFPFCW